jgi:hypothetical protein
MWFGLHFGQFSQTYLVILLPDVNIIIAISYNFSLFGRKNDVYLKKTDAMIHFFI